MYVRISPWTALAALALTASTALAQRATIGVRVHVADSSGHVVPGASVELFRGLGTRVANALTDSSGVASVGVPRDEELEVVVRRIGFQRRSVFFHSDSVDRRFEVTLQRNAVTLPTVDVTAGRDLKRERYHVDADDIANSTRPINDALDVVLKMRPTMVEPPTDGIYVHCGLYNLFVNGARIRYAPINDALAIKSFQQRRAAMYATQPGRQPMFTTQSKIPVSIQSALATIRPEHVEEMNYVDCTDTKSTDIVRAQNGLFVVLKPGIAYEPGRGSYVIASDAATAPVQAKTALSIGNSSPLGFRARIVGVFDEETGNPLADVQIVDLKSLTFATTTASGTVSLAFLPEGANEISVRHVGYVEQKLAVNISPADTIPLTLVMRPVKK